MGRIKHGMAGSVEHRAWKSAKQRCNNPKDRMFKTYGARGIKMCEDWANDFKKFYDHIGPKPHQDYSLDRIDNNKGYEPGNVRWSNDFEQAKNKTNNRMFTICCQTKHLKEWCMDFGVNYKRIHSRLRYNDDILSCIHLDLLKCRRVIKGKEFTYNGDKGSLKDLVRKYSSLQYGTVQQRMYSGLSIEDALEQGLRSNRRRIDNPPLHSPPDSFTIRETSVK